MCGIAAFIGDGQDFDPACFERMAELASRRGRDSSGLACMHRGEISVVHEVGADRRARRRLFSRMAFPLQGRFGAVFHSRLATDGRIGSPLESQPLVRDHDFVVFNGLIDWQDPRCGALLPARASIEANDTSNLLHALTAAAMETIEDRLAEIPYEMNFLWAHGSTLYAFTNVGSLYTADLEGVRFVGSEPSSIESLLDGVVAKPLPKRELTVVGKV